jgi:hypothetical protein
LADTDLRIDALKIQRKPGGRAAQPFEYFKASYRVETPAKGEPPAGETRNDYTYRLRQEHSVPIANSIQQPLSSF